MNKLFYPKLAVTNIKKNGKFYFPYLLTCICTIAMFYMMTFITFNKAMDRMPGADSIKAMMFFGCIIIGIFSVIFLFYTNSFLMKRRHKEFGLYNILGMEKRHIAKVLFFETVGIAVISLVIGLGSGILFSKLSTMLLAKILRFNIRIQFEISVIGIVSSLLLFLGIFFLILLSNLAKIQISKPIELLYGSKTGEKEPKTKFILALIGFACIGIGYYLALTTESPLDALLIFFLAVLLVIIGTYCLFTAGSIFILKILRKNKKYYYKTKHFTTVSGLLYRMKQNAVGLANICILSTMVLVMISGTVSLNLGAEDALNARYPKDIDLVYTFSDQSQFDSDREAVYIESLVKNQGLDATFYPGYKYLSFTNHLNGNQLIQDTSNYADNASIYFLVALTAQEYEKITGNQVTLNQDEVLLYYEQNPLPDTFEIFGKELHVKEIVEPFDVDEEYSAYLVNVEYIVVADDQVIDWLYDNQKEVYGKNASDFRYNISMNLEGTNEQKVDCYNYIKASLKEAGTTNVRTESKQAGRESFYSMYGGFLFLGIFLGLLFIMATVLIIYYKQISEGYDDKERFNIMQKVGMSRLEVKKSIHSQVMLVFFLPLVTASIHVLAAFKLITKLLAIFGMTNIALFAACTVGTVICFGIIYAIVYGLTARVYYKIVY